MIAFIDDQREAYGVEPICKVLPIAPSTYHAHAAKRRDPAKLSARAQRDMALKPEIARVFADNFEVCGARKVWRQMVREGFGVARCTVERLMADLGLQGVIRGKPVRTTVQDKAVPCPLDHVNRVFHASAPNRLWLSDFTYVSTWSGFVYVAFVIDAYARRIVGWRVSRTAHAAFVLDALEQALHERRPTHKAGLVHHSDRGSQGGFKWLLQYLLELRAAYRQAPLRAFAIQVPCGASPSVPRRQPRDLQRYARSSRYPSGSTGAAGRWCSRSYLVTMGCAGRRSRPARRCRCAAGRAG
jgi:Integrase core domain/HTH-like domain